MYETFTLPKQIMVVLGVIWMSLNLSAQPEGMTSPLSGDGYVVLSNGDTLKGRVNWRMKYVENNPVEIKFIAENGTPTIYNAKDVAGCGTFEDHYVSISSMKKGVPVFLNRLLDGRIKVFQNRSSIVYTYELTESTTEFDGIEFRYSRKNGLTVGPTFITSSRVIESRTRYSSYFAMKDKGDLIKIEKENFDAAFPALFSDCPEIQQELDRNPDLRKFKNFMLLAEVYNQLCK
jgi:hypothetical protein